MMKDEQLVTGELLKSGVGGSRLVRLKSCAIMSVERAMTRHELVR